MQVYYRDFLTKKLHQITASNVDENPFSVGLTIRAVEDDLTEVGELYHKPVLGLIQGGKV